MEMIKAATQMNIIVLTPLCKGSFNYCLVTHPIGNMFKGPILKSLYADLTDLGQDAGIEIISIAGDGDQRLRSIQLQQNHIPHKYQWLTKEEFPIVIGLNPRGQIAMQDLLHDLKKLRNNCKYLSKILLIFANPSIISYEERLTYAVRWDIVLFMFQNSAAFQEQVNRSAIAVHDKQDPSLATELCFTYQMFYDQGFHGMGLYLEVMYLLFTSFYDKSLSPSDRMVRASAVKTIMTTWSDVMTRLGVRTKHFVTPETHTDVIVAAKGLIWYLLECTSQQHRILFLGFLPLMDVSNFLLGCGLTRARAVRLTSMQRIFQQAFKEGTGLLS